MKMALPFPAQRSSVLRAVSLLVLLAGARCPQECPDYQNVEG
jgi:hypothetical protein